MVVVGCDFPTIFQPAAAAMTTKGCTFGAYCCALESKKSLPAAIVRIFFAASRQHNPAGLGKSIRARVYRGGKALLVPVSDAGDAGGGGGGGNKQSWKLLKMLAFAVV